MKNIENNLKNRSNINKETIKQKIYFNFLKAFKQNCRYCIFKSSSYGICSSCIKYFSFFLNPLYTYTNSMKIITLSRYTSIVREEILSFKLKDNREISKYFVLSIFNYPNLISDLSKYDVITYVPMNKRKEKYLRGYNQSKILAKDLSMVLGIPIIDLIEKVKENKTQSSISKEERILNVKDVFKVKENFCFNNILLVDDIFTTGATVFEIRKKIKEKYSKSNIDVFVLSKTISIKRANSSLVERKYKHIKLVNNRKLTRKKLLENSYKEKLFFM